MSAFEVHSNPCGSDVLCLSGPTLGFTQLSQSEGYFNACVVDPSNGNVYVGGANDSGGVLWAFSSADGSLLWMQNESFDGAFDNIVAANNNIYAFGDDIRIFNSSGTLTDTIAQSTSGVFPQSNGQIIYMTDNGVQRLNSDESTDTTFGDAGTFPAALPYGSYEGFFNLTQLDDGSFASVGGGPNGSTLTVLNFANGSGLDVSSVSPQGSSFTATPGQSFAGRVATFADENSSYSSTSDYTATIDWGDGSSPSAGTIESDGLSDGGFIVNGNHTYTSGGSYEGHKGFRPNPVRRMVCLD